MVDILILITLVRIWKKAFVMHKKSVSNYCGRLRAALVLKYPYNQSKGGHLRHCSKYS